MKGAGVVVLLACLSFVKGSAIDPANICKKISNLTVIPQDQIKGDWALVYSTSIKTRNGASYWGGNFPYDFCDPLNLNSGCMAVGYTIFPVNDTKQVGYAYALNAFNDVWTIEQVNNYVYNIPGTNLRGFRTTYNHYIQVDNSVLFANSAAQPCGNKILRSGPIYRASNYVVLANAPDLAWVVLLYCDSFFGFLDDFAPLVQILVKRDVLDKCSYPFNTLYFYNEVKTALIENDINIYASDFKLVYHDVGGAYPTSVSWSSVQWEADCTCPSY